MSDILRTKAFIDGEWVSTSSTSAITNPATGELVAEVSRCGEAEAKAALDAAERALPAWKRTSAPERSKLLLRLAALMREREEELAILLTAEQGKPLSESLGEVRYATAFCDWFAAEVLRDYGETIPGHRGSARLLTFRQAIGVGAGITPWNFPCAMITRKAAPAIGAGCTFVLKPAEATPLSALAIAALLEEAGLPKGVFNVLPGAREDAAPVGTILTGDPRVRALSFTGSTPVGRFLNEACAPTIKRVSLELGGNAPFIVFEDADLDQAVKGFMVAKFRNGGQTCVAANRTLVQESIFDAFSEKLAAAINGLKVGPGTGDGVTIGPMIDEQVISKVRAHVEDAKSKGATIRLGGADHELGKTFYQPTLIENVTTEMDMAHDETFGPVAGLMRFGTEEEAIALANDTPFGLASYFYARDIGRVWRVSEALETGMVGVNTGMVSTPVAPFGGVKESGLGREGSRYGLDEWTEIKYVCHEIE